MLLRVCPAVGQGPRWKPRDASSVYSVQPIIGRRSLIAAGVVAGAATLSSCSLDDVVSSAPSSAGSLRGAVSHQAGVTTSPQAFAALASFDVEGPDLGALCDRLIERIGRLAAAGFASVTVSVGVSLFDGRFGLEASRPALLTAMPGFPNDALESGSCGGDVLLQVCAEDAERVAATVADLARTGGLRQRWKIDGFRAENGRTVGGLAVTRNLFGFREGAGNPDPANGELMDRLVWAGEGEPVWAAGGTYQVVRLIRLATELWNRDPILHQESIFGRRRADGAPLSGGTEDGSFDYAGDPVDSAA